MHLSFWEPNCRLVTEEWLPLRETEASLESSQQPASGPHPEWE
jgi:hypothetical protein